MLTHFQLLSLITSLQTLLMIMTGDFFLFWNILLQQKISFFINITHNRMMEVIQPAQNKSQFRLASEPTDVIALRHQFPYQYFQPVVGEGPCYNPNFRNRRWVFKVEGVDMRMTVHRDDHPGALQVVSSELEKLFMDALKQCVRDGAEWDSRSPGHDFRRNTTLSAQI